jgi:hypothetical protein
MTVLPLRGPRGFVFPGGSRTGAIGERSLGTFFEDHFPDLQGHQIHGLRAAMKTWTTENGHRREAIELSLAHDFSSEADRIYLHSDLAPMRKAMYRAWSDFLCPAEAGRVAGG